MLSSDLSTVYKLDERSKYPKAKNITNDFYDGFGINI